MKRGIDNSNPAWHHSSVPPLPPPLPTSAPLLHVSSDWFTMFVVPFIASSSPLLGLSTLCIYVYNGGGGGGGGRSLNLLHFYSIRTSEESANCKNLLKGWPRHARRSYFIVFRCQSFWILMSLSLLTHTNVKSVPILQAIK